MITLDRVRKEYADGTVAVNELSLDIDDGQIAVLVGPSGCGKTTTMRMVNRLVDPTAGHIYLDGDDISTVDRVALRRRIGYVIQQVGLFPHQSVADNVATVPQLLGWDKRRTRSRVTELLELVGLEERHAKRYPHELSGGQRQRVGVARALAADPPVLLMDEPFGAVDPVARDRLQAEFLRLQQQVRKTIVFVTHDIDEAIRMGDRIAVMREGGHLEQYADPKTLLSEPATAFVADFVGADRTLRRPRRRTGVAESGGRAVGCHRRRIGSGPGSRGRAGCLAGAGPRRAAGHRRAGRRRRRHRGLRGGAH
jgi:osmoprotectant transport system ATP-binding protein